MYRDLLLDHLGVNFLGPAPLDLELLHMLTTFHWNALGSTLGWWFCHNNTVSCNEKFWVEQVTVPHPPPGEGQGVGNDRGGGYGWSHMGSNLRRKYSRARAISNKRSTQCQLATLYTCATIKDGAKSIQMDATYGMLVFEGTNTIQIPGQSGYINPACGIGGAHVGCHPACL